MNVLTVAPNVTLEFVHVPAGEFLMGSSDDDQEANAAEKPQHKVNLPAYLIGKYPVTVAQFVAFVKATGYKLNVASDLQRKANHPVTHVTWNDAIAFCRWASQATGQPVRLPTEAEWEKAARSTDGRLFPWDNREPDKTLCNFNVNVGDTTPVGQYSPRGDSPYGCADMVGNVWEWCSSLRKPYPFDARDGRENLKSVSARVVRGGSWVDPRGGCRAALRYRFVAAYFSDDVGFRLARSPVGS